jgi:CRP-like cAMP-binding protein
MKQFLSVLKTSPLFYGMEEQEIETMLGCFSAEWRAFAKNDFLLRVGDEVDSLGLVLSGSVHIIQEDFWGNRNIIAEIGTGQVFAESYACTQGATLGVSVVAAEETAALFLNIRSVMTTCASSCAFHARLIRNLLSALAEKNLRMNEKLSHMTKRSTREKLLSYLSLESQRRGSAAFDIPFNRQQLADYLSVERSAMSSELGRLRDEGVLSFDKNHFHLYHSTET